MKVILQATEINKPVQPKLKELFSGEQIYHYIVWNGIVTDYTDSNMVAEFYAEGGSKVIEIVRKHRDAEYYIITSGGVLQGIVLYKLLQTQGVQAKLIVYEPNIAKYVVVPFEIYGANN